MKRGESMESEKGLIIAYYGDGKGKTTAALGLALRASGLNKRARIIQFIKGPWKTAEESAIKKIRNIELEKTGLGFVGIQDDKNKIGDHRRMALAGLKRVTESYREKDLFILILDEILGAIGGGILKASEVAEIVKSKPAKLNLVLTGRPKIKKIISISDLVSEIREIKHPFRKGRLGVRGIDY